MPTFATSAPAVNPTPDPVLAAERAILAAEGPYHVAGRYIADATLCDRARREEAAQRVARAGRVARWLQAHPCAFCGRTIAADEPFVVVGLEPLHVVVCAAELDAMLYPTEVAA